MSVSPSELETLLLGSQELALLDVREARFSHRAHPSLARHAPLSGLELQIGAFVPRRATPIVIYDDADAPGGVAERAATLLQRLGYANVRRLDGGLAAWIAWGLPVVDGYNALVKAFADLARVHYRTPVLTLAELEARQRDDQPTRLVDARPHNEYRFLSIAGADNYAGTELALRDTAAGDPQAVWAVNCFSRTRGIVGATTLRILRGRQNAAFVEDGVMAWALRGSPVTQNAIPAAELPEASPEDLRASADEVVSRFELKRIDVDELDRLKLDTERTLYVFDVRPADSRASASRASIVRHVPGGQLLMHFENLVGTRNARVVLIDDSHGLRAAVTAFWLTQLNQAEVFVLTSSDVEQLDLDDAHRSPRDDDTIDIAMEAQEVAALHRRRQAIFIDVGPSLEFERRHLPDASFLLPTSLDPLASLVSDSRTLVFVSPDGAAARLVARDTLLRWPQAKAVWLRGGTQAWVEAGEPYESAYRSEQLLTPFDDDGGSVMRVFGARRDEAWRAYLEWERGIAARVAQDPTVRFQFFAAQ
jgi:rhodanese-related sulfurtransferase